MSLDRYYFLIFQRQKVTYPQFFSFLNINALVSNDTIFRNNTDAKSCHAYFMVIPKVKPFLIGKTKRISPGNGIIVVHIGGIETTCVTFRACLGDTKDYTIPINL